MAYVPPSRRPTRAIKNSFRTPQKCISNSTPQTEGDFPTLSGAKSYEGKPSRQAENAKIWGNFKFDSNVVVTITEPTIMNPTTEPEINPEMYIDDFAMVDISSDEIDDKYLDSITSARHFDEYV